MTEEGDPDLFFDDLGTAGGEDDASPIPLPEAVDDAINGASEEANTIKALRGVTDIDDNNELAPKMFQQWQTHQTGYYLQNGAMMGFVSGRVKILEVLMQD